jgi:general secretion pathway protein E
MPSYLLSSTDGRGYLVSLDKPITIGRNKDNVLALNDDAASRYHCVVESDGMGGFRVRDLGSRNGTKVNAHRVMAGSHPLNVGDVVKVGTHSFALEQEMNLGEVKADVRSRTIDSDEAWADELMGILMGLPPKNEGDEPLGMLNAAHESTGALGGDTPGPKATRVLLLLAAKSRATDIHVEPKMGKYSVRFRVDGQMCHIADIPEKVGVLVVGLVKTACLMRQMAADAVMDGHFAAKFKGRRVDYRVSITPSMHGQKMVIRVLDGANAPRSLNELGMPPYMHERLRKVCTKEQGFVLVCGPTGSGKTTTLYNALREIDRDTTNVVTIEDPVEYQLEGVTQIPIDENKGNTFKELLRSVLRQDPDVILVGEIRDEETARTAMQAAMTGHLVFSTVHSKDSISAVFRILDLKVEPFLVASSLDLVVAQRLVRALCENCKSTIRVAPGQATRIGKYLDGKNETYAPIGCAQCLRSGYRGRKAIYEALDFSDELRDIVMKEPTIAAIRKVLEQSHFSTLLQAGWTLAAKGVTSLEEVERVCGSGV